MTTGDAAGTGEELQNGNTNPDVFNVAASTPAKCTTCLERFTCPTLKSFNALSGAQAENNTTPSNTHETGMVAACE
jgi:hypothetical protein